MLDAMRSDFTIDWDVRWARAERAASSIRYAEQTESQNVWDEIQSVWDCVEVPILRD
jgi:hypothetical protein